MSQRVGKIPIDDELAEIHSYRVLDNQNYYNVLTNKYIIHKVTGGEIVVQFNPLKINNYENKFVKVINIDFRKKVN